MENSMLRRPSHAALAAALIVVLLPLSLSAQRATRRVFISALDARGVPLDDLTPADLEVQENGTTREVTRVSRGNAPLRVVLLVDSSTSMAPMVNAFRNGLNTFAETLPAEHEVTFISTGGQIRIRTQPSADRVKLKTEIDRFATDNGANAFLDTMIEADKRFMKTVPGQWPMFVIVTTDKGENRREMRIDDYNKFMNDFLMRGGVAHAVVIVGSAVGPVTDLTQNLVENTGGIYSSITTDFALAERLKAIAERLARDHRAMFNRYEVEYNGDGKILQPMVIVKAKREGAQIQMSPRRPF
jgi:hypothetical protein